MSHFAKIEDGIVVQVIVAEQDVIDTGIFGNPNDWVQTSYNTYGGVHLQGGVPMRKNYAGIGYTYDYVRDAFIAPKQYASWVLNENTCKWEAPIPKPDENKLYTWNEDLIDWVEIKFTHGQHQAQ